ncbi:dihydroxy-acid dehydratase [Paraburkholderia sp. HC6.4b]|uniref:dihydroxy-acid dehydratase n=1 Tax=unclassified Paraburkholderia TaxID=2615204 RepID=UPI00161F9BE3|nr:MULTISPECIES: dihydroxy-acid dehydratase [unclassified Paraburkholderia]MBB5409300.1 dihydroxy-acid dehydratase [Paraburkholderia sp. HC6.4b]MBB5451028.1 dihydroxy-acid dehydratase [Paraburkholderia sp. Kb1A]
MNKPKLRSSFTPGTTRWAVRRAQWLAMGLSEEDFEKPKIAIVNSSSKLSVCYQHLDGVSQVVQDAVRAAGGVPLEIRTVAPSDFVTSAGKQGRYLMPTRDLLVNDVEVQVEGAELDGMVLLASCDKTTPAQLMAAGRLNVPSLIVTCGFQLGSQCGDHHVDIEEVYKSVGAYKARTITLEKLTDMTCHAIKGPGVCAGLATANSMHCMAEALGMALTGNAPIRAGSDELNGYAASAGKAIMALVEQDLRPRQIMTAAAFRNAVRVAVAIGASVNVMRHLIAAAIESECDVDIIREFELAAHLVPQITKVRPNGPDRIEDFAAAGGCAGAMKQLASVLDTSVLTVTGRTLADNLAGQPAPDERVIAPLAQPMRPEPGLVIIRGNVAPDGAIVKLSAVPASVRRFIGPAAVYENENDAINAIEQGKIERGSVVVLRMLGPKGGPGTVFAASFMAALVGAGLGESVAVVTDGELSGLNSGITIGQVMPEAAEGGPLAAIQNGDTIVIDLNRKTIDLELSDAVLRERMAALPPLPPTQEKGWLAMYRQLVQPLSKGAVLGEREVPGSRR